MTAQNSECPGCAKMRAWGRTAYKRGYDIGVGTSALHLSQALEALAAEKEAHHATNAALTEYISMLESRLDTK